MRGIFEKKVQIPCYALSVSKADTSSALRFSCDHIGPPYIAIGAGLCACLHTKNSRPDCSERENVIVSC